MATMLNFWVTDQNNRTVYFSRIRANHDVAAENETISMLCNIAGVDRDSFKAIDLLQTVFGVSGWRSTMRPNEVYLYYMFERGVGYTYHWQITETDTNELAPTIY